MVKTISNHLHEKIACLTSFDTLKYINFAPTCYGYNLHYFEATELALSKFKKTNNYSIRNSLFTAEA